MALLVVILLSVSTFLNDIPTGMWALIGTIVGTVGLRVTDKWLSKNVERRSERAQFVEELAAANERIDHLETEVESWRNKFYALQAEHAAMKVEMISHGWHPDMNTNPKTSE